MDAPLRWFPRPAAAGTRLISVDAARLVGRFLSDPLARLPSFPRYGSSEFPFAVALKTGTSQGYRDAWTLEWSRDYLVGVWVGRADAGPMTQLSGARAAAQLAQAVMLRLHGAGRADLVAGEFAAPPGREQAELCTGTGARAEPGCGQRLAEWVRPGAPARAAPAAAAVHRAAGSGHACLAQPGGARGAEPAGAARDGRAAGAADRLAGGRPAGRHRRAGRAAALADGAGPPPVPDTPAAGGGRVAAGGGRGGVSAAAAAGADGRRLEPRRPAAAWCRMIRPARTVDHHRRLLRHRPLHGRVFARGAGSVGLIARGEAGLAAAATDVQRGGRRRPRRWPTWRTAPRCAGRPSAGRGSSARRTSGSTAPATASMAGSPRCRRRVRPRDRGHLRRHRQRLPRGAGADAAARRGHHRQRVLRRGLPRPAADDVLFRRQGGGARLRPGAAGGADDRAQRASASAACSRRR